MDAAEPTHTALLLAVLGLLLGLSVLFSRSAARLGLPVSLLFIVIGILAGSDGIGRIEFDDYALTFRVGIICLVLILFDGGLNTPRASVNESLGPAAVLATVGVVGTAVLLAGAARLFGFPWTEALLLGAIVSSTDAAVVFSVLRGSGLQLKKRVGATLELESGLNDPMAVILTFSLTAALLTRQSVGWSLAGTAVLQIAVGGALGIGLGMAGRQLLRRVRLLAGGLYPVLTTALAFLAFALPTLLGGSGFLAVYLVAILLGNEAIRYRSGLLRVHDSLAWLSQVTMFLALGLLVSPSQLVPVAWSGLGLGLVLAFIARPLVVLLCLLPFGYPAKEALYVGWVGLRGAVPIILATFPVLANAPGARTLFNVVFFIVVVNALVPGATVRWVTLKLGLASDAPPPPPAALEITSTQLLVGELLSFYIRPASAVCGATIGQLPFPPSAAATLVIRGRELFAPKGGTELLAGDHVYVFCLPEDVPLVQLMFGSPEAE